MSIENVLQDAERVHHGFESLRNEIDQEMAMLQQAVTQGQQEFRAIEQTLKELSCVASSMNQSLQQGRDTLTQVDSQEQGIQSIVYHIDSILSLHHVSRLPSILEKHVAPLPTSVLRTPELPIVAPVTRKEIEAIPLTPFSDHEESWDRISAELKIMSQELEDALDVLQEAEDLVERSEERQKNRAAPTKTVPTTQPTRTKE